MAENFTIAEAIARTVPSGGGGAAKRPGPPQFVIIQCGQSAAATAMSVEVQETRHRGLLLARKDDAEPAACSDTAAET